MLSAPAYARKIKNLSTALKRQDNAFHELSQRIAEQFRSFRQPHADPVTPEGIIVHELAKTTKPVSTMVKKAAKHDGKSAGKNGRNSDTGKKNKKLQEQAADNAPKVYGKHGRYEASPKHNINSKGFISKPPRDGQKALDNSIPYPDKPNARISVEDGKLVEFKLTLDQSGILGGVKVRHGFVHGEDWGEISEKIRRSLEAKGIADKKGRALFDK